MGSKREYADRTSTHSAPRIRPGQATEIRGNAIKLWESNELQSHTLDALDKVIQAVNNSTEISRITIDYNQTIGDKEGGTQVLMRTGGPTDDFGKAQSMYVALQANMHKIKNYLKERLKNKDINIRVNDPTGSKNPNSLKLTYE